jgi:hypothetical protein
MSWAFKEDQYSADGSIVNTDSDDDKYRYIYKGQSIPLDLRYLEQAFRKHLWLEQANAGDATGAPPGVNAEDVDSCWGGHKKKK